MSNKRGSRWFTDDGPGLDKFGVVLGLSILSVAVLSLIDLDNAPSGIRSEVGWVIVTMTVAATLVASLRVSGVSRRPRRIIEFLLIVGVLGIIMVFIANEIAGADTIFDQRSDRPSAWWTLTAAASPALVLRWVMKQRTITAQTLAGAVSVYLLVALAFNYAFLGADSANAAVPFFGTVESTSSFMYYSLTTITTVGYGDLAAVGDVGRFLSSAEAVIGQVLLVTVIARLVAMYSPSYRPATGAGGQSNSVTVE